MKWQAFEIVAEGKSGTRFVGRDILGRTMPEDMSINAGFVEREKTFKVGEPIRLSQQDLWEICFFFGAKCIPSLTESIVKFLDQHGIKMNQVNRVRTSPEA